MRDRRELAYRVYVTDCLKLLARVEERYIDWVRPNVETESTDARTGDEIKADIRAGLMARREMEKQNGLVRSVGEDFA